MPREEDYKDFRDVISGRLRKSLKDKIASGGIVRVRGKNGKVIFSLPKIDQPFISHNPPGYGFGRGPGKIGDVVKRDPQEGDGSADEAGEGEAEGIRVAVDLDEVLKFLQDELRLPDLKPKHERIFDEIELKYNDVSNVGPESLRHNRKTWLEALKRQAAQGDAPLEHVPGLVDPVPIILPVPRDKRYRRYNEIPIPSGNALIIYARDGSGSMDEEKCEIVSDMAWWIDVWIRRFYKRTERMFVWHDWTAKEVDEETFYNYRYGGGTCCSSAVKFVSKQLENRFPVDRWNVYFFYFTDGDNWASDNPVFLESLAELNGKINLFALTQVMSYPRTDGLRQIVEAAMRAGKYGPEFRTVGVSEGVRLTGDERNEAVLKAIRSVLGAKQNV